MTNVTLTATSHVLIGKSIRDDACNAYGNVSCFDHPRIVDACDAYDHVSCFENDQKR